jgi:hypothetical protein
MESMNHVASSVSSSIDFLTLCHRLKVCVEPYRLLPIPKSKQWIELTTLESGSQFLNWRSA